jgi:hypothetical protein
MDGVMHSRRHCYGQVLPEHITTLSSIYKLYQFLTQHNASKAETTA